jgi:hypothetical protein
MLRFVLPAVLFSLAAPAQAAEVKPVKAAPASQNANCAIHGQGFIGVGSSTCMKLSGRVRADAIAPAPKGPAGSSFQTEGEINVDTRTATEYGTLRGVVRYRAGMQPGVN